MRPVFRSKHEVGYQILRKAILKGEYKPGSRLIIDDLAATLGVSQIPIREALRQLEADGFVTIEPYIGATVTPIDASFILEIFALLEALESIASRAACINMTTEQLNELNRLVEQMDHSQDNPEQWSQENKEFHLFICDCAKMTLVLKMMTKVLDHWDRLRFHYLQDVTGKRVPVAQAEHKRVLAAFQQRDPDAVEREIRAHNHSALSSYIAYLEQSGHIVIPPNSKR